MYRREFIKNSSIIIAGSPILDSHLYSSRSSKNKIIIGLIGLNIQGIEFAKYISHLPNIEIRYVYDDSGKISINKAIQENKIAKNPIILDNTRELIEKADCKALLIFKRNLWALTDTFASISKDKHVYFDESFDFNACEIELFLNGVIEKEIVLQNSKHRESLPAINMALKLVNEGIIGDPYFAKGYHTFDAKYKAANNETDRKINALIKIDFCRLFLNVDYPTKVKCSIAENLFSDSFQIPNNHDLYIEFIDKSAIWESRECLTSDQKDEIGFIIYASKGKIKSHGYDSYKLYNRNDQLIREISSASNDVENKKRIEIARLETFINSIGRPTKPVVSFSGSFNSMLLSHFANESCRLGNTLICDPTNGRIISATEEMSM